MPTEIRMGNCLRLGISRIGLAWSKWRIAAKFKKKNVSIIILGMQAVGKTTIALRLYKFKRALPDTNYVQTKGFNTYTVKKNKTTVNIYDLGGHPSIQELWDHYYADAHGVIFVVDSSKRESVPEAGNLLSTVLSDIRISGKPVLLLANKIDLGGISEAELDTMLNLQQLVNSVRCLTRLDVSCATDLKDDKGIFEGFKWLISYIESNYYDLNSRVLSDIMVEKNREKARREAVKAARIAEGVKEESVQENGIVPGNSPAPTNPITTDSDAHQEEADNSVSVANEVKSVDTEQNLTDVSPSGDTPSILNASEDTNKQEESFTPPSKKLSRKIETKPIPAESVPLSRIPLTALPPVHSVPADLFDDKPVKLPRLKSPKSRPEKLSRIEDNTCIDTSQMHQYSGTFPSSGPDSDENYRNKGFRFKNYSAANRPSPEGADSDDGIVNMAYEPSEDLSSDSTPIGVRKHDFTGEPQNKDIFMITTLAEVHKEYFKERKSSTSTHDSVSMSVESCMSDFTDPGATGIDETDYKKSSLHNTMYPNSHHNTEMQNFPRNAETSLSKKGAIPISKGKSKKRLNNLKQRNKTAPAPMPIDVVDQTSGSALIRSTGSPMAVDTIENKFSAMKPPFPEKFSVQVPSKGIESSDARSSNVNNTWMDTTEENGNA